MREREVKLGYVCRAIWLACPPELGCSGVVVVSGRLRGAGEATVAALDAALLALVAAHVDGRAAPRGGSLAVACVEPVELVVTARALQRAVEAAPIAGLALTAKLRGFVASAPAMELLRDPAEPAHGAWQWVRAELALADEAMGGCAVAWQRHQPKAIEPEGAMLVLCLDAPELEILVIGTERFTIGGRGDSDLVLAQPSIAERHAVITREMTCWKVGDLGSRSTRVDGQEIRRATRLVPGSMIELGHQPLRVIAICDPDNTDVAPDTISLSLADRERVAGLGPALVCVHGRLALRSVAERDLPRVHAALAAALRPILDTYRGLLVAMVGAEVALAFAAATDAANAALALYARLASEPIAGHAIAIRTGMSAGEGGEVEGLIVEAAEAAREILGIPAELATQSVTVALRKRGYGIAPRYGVARLPPQLVNGVEGLLLLWIVGPSTNFALAASTDQILGRTAEMSDPRLELRHVRLARTREAWTVEPIGTAPVSLDGGRIARARPVCAGSVIQIGDTVIEVIRAELRASGWGDDDR